MRLAGFIAAVVFVLGCGPDPNAQLPGVNPVGKGGAGGAGGAGGVTSTGGITTAPGSGGRAGTGGTTSSGGVTGSGGVTATGGSKGTGGRTGSGGITTVPGSGGTTAATGGRSGTGGTTTTTPRDGGVRDVPGSGGVTGSGGARGTGGTPGIDGGGGSEPCVPAATVTGAGSANSGSFGTTGAYCFRTPDNIAGWGCSNFTGRTLKVNGVTEICSALPLPAKVNGYYYFDASAGSYIYAAIYWW
jgi:hypothetical protein